jgi:hypothetical protein
MKKKVMAPGTEDWRFEMEIPSGLGVTFVHREKWFTVAAHSLEYYGYTRVSEVGDARCSKAAVNN